MPRKSLLARQRRRAAAHSFSTVVMAAALLAACTSAPTIQKVDGAGSEPATSATSASGTCLAGDPNCADDGAGQPAGPPQDDLAADDVLNPEGPIFLTFGGHLLISEGTARLCAVLLESFPPQCGDEIIAIAASTNDVLEHIAESFGDPETSRIQNEGDVWWTDEWVLISGVLEGDILVIED